MKKLMIALAAVSMTVAANAAATMLWNAYGYTGDPLDGGAWFTGGQAYLVLLSESGTYDTMDSLLAAGTIVDSASISGGDTGTVQIDNADSIFGESGTKYAAMLFTTEGTGLGGEPATYGIPTTGKYGIYQGEFEYTAGAGGTFYIPEEYNNYYGAVAANQPVGVPEPTSGLLLLLGVAGLALRRRA